MKFVEDKRVHVPANTAFVKTKYLDIVYAPGSDRRKLDIYLPNEEKGPFPVIIDIFGGGWFFGNKSSHKLEPALNLLRRGFAVVSIDYTLSKEQTSEEMFPIQVHEVKSAIRFIKKYASRYNLDGSKIALMGESAGAHYAALCAISASKGELEDSSWPHREVDSTVQAVIAVYCPAHLGKMREYFSVMQQRSSIEEWGETDSMEGALFGWRSADDSEARRLAKIGDPNEYLNPDMPPFLFLHGTEDRVIPMLASMELAANIMYEIGLHNVEYRVVPGARHNILDFETEEIYDIEAAFLRKHLVHNNAI